MAEGSQSSGQEIHDLSFSVRITGETMKEGCRKKETGGRENGVMNGWRSLKI